MKSRDMVVSARIPALALIPLLLIGCDEEDSGDSNDTTNTGGGGSGSGGSGSGGSGSGGSGSGGSGSGGSGSGGSGSGGSGGSSIDSVDAFLDATAAARRRLCEEGDFCGDDSYASVVECLNYTESYAAEYYGDLSPNCLELLADYINCYAAGPFECEYDEEYGYSTYSGADCDQEYAALEQQCGQL